MHAKRDNSSLLYHTAGGTPYLKTADSKVTFDKLPPEIPRTAPTRETAKVSKLSFEDYHKTWSGIATSKTNDAVKNPCKYCHVHIYSKLIVVLKFINNDF